MILYLNLTPEIVIQIIISAKGYSINQSRRFQNMSAEKEFLRSEEQIWDTMNPRSRALYERACRVIPSGSTRRSTFYRPYPAYLARGEGSHVWDVDGNKRVDNFFNAAVLICGHNHPKIMKAVEAQLACGTVLGGPTEVQVELAEILVERWPCAEMARFTSSGSEAILQACRVARSYTGKDKIGKFEGSYHGCWDAVDISVAPPLEKAGPPMHPNSVRQHEGIPEGVLRNTITMPYNDAEAATENIRRHADELAAVVVEPAASFCSILPKEGFLEAVREVTERYGIVLIFDEIVSQGVSPGGAQKLFGVTPDITTLGKLIGGGFPVGAFVGREDIMEPVLRMPESGSPRLSFSGTYNAFPVTMAAGIATHELLTKDAYERMSRFSGEIQSGLKRMLGGLGIETHVGGLGRHYNISWTKEAPVDFRSRATAAPRLANHLQLAMLNRYVHRLGILCSVTTREDVKKILEALNESLTALKPVIQEIAPHLVSS